MGRILHIKSSVHTHPHRYKPTWQKVNRCSFYLCYRKKLCFVLLIHKLNLEDMKSAYGARRPMANTNIYGRNMSYSKLFSFQVLNRFLFVCFSDFVLPYISESSFSHHFFFSYHLQREKFKGRVIWNYIQDLFVDWLYFKIVFCFMACKMTPKIMLLGLFAKTCLNQQ